MIRSSFASFTTARLALRASQTGLDITGQNIANINTTGYTRQVVDLVSLSIGNGSDHYSSSNDVNIGSGVLVSGISQLRDMFLDIRFRSEMGDVGYYDSKASVLEDLEGILDEVGDKGSIQNQLADLLTQLTNLAGEVGNEEFDSMVKSSAEVLTNYFNQYANQLETIRNDQQYTLTDVDIPDINDILSNIEKLNQTIKNNQIHGNDSLELMDQRNTLIDELASYMKIEVKYVPVTIPNSSIVVEELHINLVGDTQKFALIDDDEAASFSTSIAGDGTINVSMTPAGSATAVAINDELTTGSVKGALDMLNCSGTFDADANSPKGVGYYEKMLDTLAAKIASVFNDNNQYTDSGGVVHSYPLFEASDGSGTITARNFSISEDWENGTIGIVSTTDADQTVGKNDNILTLISKMSEDFDFTTVVGGVTRTLFSGTFRECTTNIGSVLSLEISSTTSILSNHISVANTISDARDSVSSVSLDEEGINILQYQKSYNAAARLMTALDEALDTIINNMGIVGR